MPASEALPRAADRPLAPYPMISVIIPVRNEQGQIGAVLRQLLDQDYPPDRYEILVADGESTDGTADVVRGYERAGSPRVALFKNPGRLSSAGRNVGIRHSRGDIVIFIDGHCSIPTCSLLSETARILQVTGADCLCRPQPLTAESGDSLQDVIARARASALGHGRGSLIYDVHYEGFTDPTSSGATYRRRVFERIGPYDETFDACEDVEFNYRVLRSGLTSYASPRLAVYYQARTSFRGLFRQLFRYGRGRFRLLRRHPESASVGQLIPSAFLAALIAGPLLTIPLVRVRLLFLTVVAFYLALLIGFPAGFGFRYGWRHVLYGPPVYVAIHLGLGLGWWAEACDTVLRRAGMIQDRLRAAGSDAYRMKERLALRRSSGER